MFARSGQFPFASFTTGSVQNISRFAFGYPAGRIIRRLAFRDAYAAGKSNSSITTCVSAPTRDTVYFRFFSARKSRSISGSKVVDRVNVAHDTPGLRVT